MIEVHCKFFNIPWTFTETSYACKIDYQVIPSSFEEIIFMGDHKSGKCDEDVQFLYIYCCNMKQIPKGISAKFKNAEIFHVFNSNVERVTKFDLKDFRRLKVISFTFNDIEYLPSDLFEFNGEVESVNFFGNDIKFIGENLLDNLPNLNYADFSSNANINCIFNPGVLGTLTLNQLKIVIRDDCAPPKDEKEMLEEEDVGGEN